MKLNFSEATIRTVDSYTFMTDRFMTMAFDKPVAQHILSVIMDKKLVVKAVRSQPVEDNFFSRSCRFDVLAEDSTGKIYNIEVQNSNEGAIPQRARYNCEKLDELLIRKGMSYEDYPETYVIFITKMMCSRTDCPFITLSAASKKPANALRMANTSFTSTAKSRIPALRLAS